MRQRWHLRHSNQSASEGVVSGIGKETGEDAYNSRALMTEASGVPTIELV